MIQVGIIGGSGYTAGELLRILVHHNGVTINFVYSTTNAGVSIAKQHPDLLGTIAFDFTNKVNPDVDVVFLCLGHGKSKRFLLENKFSNKTKVIDLGNDFRLHQDQHFEGRDFIYGLPELQKEKIAAANNIANPGCFATAIQLGVLPLASKGLLKQGIHVNATTGSTGAGVQPGATTHFSWRANNFSSYKVFQHQHLDEIKQSLQQKQSGFKAPIYFVPNRGNFIKGIYTTLYTQYDGTTEEAVTLYKQYYKNTPFTLISEDQISLKQVLNTNKCIVHLQKNNEMLVITTVLDNLIKGASGQAVQNMNLMFGLGETTGLDLKASAF